MLNLAIALQAHIRTGSGSSSCINERVAASRKGSS